MNPDQRLHDALHRTSQQFGPHRGDLVARAAARGHRLRLIRRAQIGTAAVLTAGACVAGTVAFGDHPSSAPPAPAAPPAVTATPAPAPTRTPSASPPAGGPRNGPISGQLAAFLPPGRITRTNSNGGFVDGRILRERPEGNPSSGGGFTYDDGKGTSVIEVDLSDDPKSWDCHPSSPEDCPETLPDGTKVLVRPGRIVGGGIRLTVDTQRPDGRRVEVVEYNIDHIDPAEKSPTPTRPDLPLTVDQLRGIALSPHWNR
ncbi:hypothetical protein ACWCXH_13965 [Kitasatospora sp. NPDC001660]